MHFLFLHYLAVWAPLGYFLIFIGLLLEGNFVLFTAAFLTHQKIFDFGDMLVIVISGALIGDILWYFLGWHFFWSRNGGDFFIVRWLEKLNKPFDGYLQFHPWRAFFVSKFVYGFHRSVLVRAGWLKIPFKDFLMADSIALVFWIIIVGGLGYGTGALSLFLKHYFKIAEFALLFGFVIFVLLAHFAAKRSQKIS